MGSYLRGERTWGFLTSLPACPTLIYAPHKKCQPFCCNAACDICEQHGQGGSPRLTLLALASPRPSARPRLTDAKNSCWLQIAATQRARRGGRHSPMGLTRRTERGLGRLTIWVRRLARPWQGDLCDRLERSFMSGFAARGRQ